MGCHVTASPQAPSGEVGTAHHPRPATGRGGEVHFAVEEIGAADGANLHGVLPHPCRATPGQGLLRQHVPGLQAALDEGKRLGLLPARIHLLNRAGIAKQEPGAAHGLQLVRQEGKPWMVK